MPTYEYLCPGCGGFDALRPIAERNVPCACPGCGAPSERVLLTAPALSNLSTEVMKAHAVNERSSHSPRCSCASHRKPTKKGARGFPAKRPWMISH
jgi:putative FmdB family regulatory protein